MAEILLAPRADRLDTLLAELLRAQAQTQRQIDRTSLELRDFKDEMRAFKDEMRVFKQETRQESREMNRR